LDTVIVTDHVQVATEVIHVFALYGM